MKIKYLFIFTLILIQGLILIYARYNAGNIMPLIQIFGDSRDQHPFSDNGLLSMKRDYSCLDTSVQRLFLTKKDAKASEETMYLQIFKETAKNFPIHILKTRKESVYIEVDILYNMPSPFTITYKLVPSNGGYKIEEIKNACQLFKTVNLYFAEQNK